MKPILLTLCSFFLFTLTVYADNESRTWTDSTGQFKVEATLVKVEGDKVTIEKADGKFLTLEKSQLSKNDQDYLAKIAANPFAGGVDNPFAGGSDRPGIAASSQATPVKREPAPRRSPGTSTATRAPKEPFSFGKPGGDVFEFEPVPVDLHAAPAAGGNAETSWACEPDPMPELNLNLKPRNVVFRIGDLPSGVDNDDGGMFVYSREGLTKVLAVRNIDMEDKGVNATVVFFGDLTTGKTSSTHFARKVELLGVSPGGTKAMLREKAWGFGSQDGTKNCLHIVAIQDSALEFLAVYEPFADDVKPDDKRNRGVDIELGAWIDDQHVILTSDDRTIAMNIESGEVLWQTSAIGKIALSSGRKYCLVQRSRRMTLMENLTGNPIGCLDQARGSGYAFSPDGKKIASNDSGYICLWDATTGKAEEPFYIGKG